MSGRSADVAPTPPQSPNGQPSRKGGASWQRLLMLAMATAVLVPSLYGFGTKFLEFLALYRGDVEGVFAITPIVNYLLASLGFLCLFGWAIFHGMFRDIEQPKHKLLETERLLDERESAAAGARYSWTQASAILPRFDGRTTRFRAGH